MTDFKGVEFDGFKKRYEKPFTDFGKTSFCKVFEISLNLYHIKMWSPILANHICGRDLESVEYYDKISKKRVQKVDIGYFNSIKTFVQRQFNT